MMKRPLDHLCMVCQEITGGQWYDLNGALFPLAAEDNIHPHLEGWDKEMRVEE